MIDKLYFVHHYGNDDVEVYYKNISPNNIYTPLIPGTPEYVQEKYRQKIKNSRSRAKQRGMSYSFKYHNVFTSTNPEISRNPKLFMDTVVKILNKQHMKFFLVIELNHPRKIWLYDNENEDFVEKDGIVNAYGCYNRICLEPLQEEEGFHIHVLTDREVDFTEYIENVECDINNLYSEEFEYSQLHNINYLLKYFYYTKSTLPDNLNVYRANVKLIRRNTDILTEEEYNNLLFTSSISFNCNNNCKFHPLSDLVIKSPLLKLNSLVNKEVNNHYSSFYNAFSIVFDVKNGCKCKNAYLKSSKGKNVDNIRDFVSNTKRYARLILPENPLIYIEFSIKKSNTREKGSLVPFFWENWLLKYIIYVRNIPKNRPVK